MSYKYLLFDLDHTLLDFNQGEEVALTQFLEFMDVEDIEAFKAIYRPLNQGMWKELEKGLITKKELINTRFSKTFAHFGREVDGREMALRYQEFIGQQGQIFEGADLLLKELVDRGYQLYAATNGVTYIQENRLLNSPIQTYFKQVFISEQMGTQKPAADFYEKIAEQIGCFDMASFLMIGDSLTADIQGANNVGMDSVWYNPEQVSLTGPAQPTYTVSNYQQLLDILKE
ncbi:YjjG family noncanonical pyrimidine nucleotidase [Streptococcus iners]|uniref:YjjG family noncanonical pyrimidine nucleotidase n=1 Tax=Streptococcus iners subsp. hyiners TaxID=3028083 RepID=A0AA96VKV1_9STRE|nr:YjjG family noncanonical pyrimidine nucleotidase [Streptococcus sp. 29892]MCK4029067.1 noncanonical pyrimidine nucleotidase, YjjG family [Streptococcus suis]WNY49898.1 YjjG family noncanonical pyrimidine nucleotidase [Streptococcus sp. 29892]